MPEVCPEHGQVDLALEWCAGDAGRVHLGARCPVCRLWLRWVASGTLPRARFRLTKRLAIPDEVPLFSRPKGRDKDAQETQGSHHPVRVDR